jgi:hypothetical protein
MKTSLMVVTLLLVWLSNGWCTIIRVPEDFSTIQAALDSTADGDTVLVADGIYYTNLISPQHNFVLASYFIIDGDSFHIDSTILDGSQFTNPDSASVFCISGGQDSTTVITGLTITGGKGTKRWFIGTYLWHGGGCFIYNASPILQHNHFLRDTTDHGGGIYLGKDANAIIRNNEFSENYAAHTGGCVRADSCSPSFIGNNLHDNWGYNCAGIKCVSCGEVNISGNFIHDNFGYSDLSICIVATSGANLQNNIISANICQPGAIGGAGILVQDVEVVITNNQFLNNNGGMAYGALCLTQGSRGVVNNNTFIGNSCGNGGNAIFMYDSHFVISGNEFIQNYSNDYGTAVSVGQFAGAHLSYNTFNGNVTEGDLGSAINSIHPDSCILIYNNILGNSSPAVAVEDSNYFSVETIATDNWWGHPSGPFHPLLNPNGLGDTVGDSVLFTPWLEGTVWVEPESPPILLPEKFEFQPAYPNPFNASTTIRFNLPHPSKVCLAVFDSNGRLVTKLVNGWRQPGTHEVVLNSSSLVSGVYFLSLKADGFYDCGKLILIK